MTRWIVRAGLVSLTLALTSSASAQQVPGNPGFNRLLCMAGDLIEITPITDPDPNTNIGSAEVFLPHGTSGGGSTHVVVYRDSNGSGELDCGDAVLSIS